MKLLVLLFLCSYSKMELDSVGFPSGILVLKEGELISIVRDAEVKHGRVAWEGIRVRVMSME